MSTGLSRLFDFAGFESETPKKIGRLLPDRISACYVWLALFIRLLCRAFDQV